METRRGFLKTLGKLGAAVGLTAAACSVHRPHHPHHPKHPKRSFSETEALSHAVQKAGFNRTNGGDDMTWTDLDTQKAKGHTALKAMERTAPMGKEVFEVGFSGFKKHDRDKIELAQKAIDALAQARIDNTRMAMQPDFLVLPPAVYSKMQHSAAMQRLDPYHWYDVWDVEWHTWKSTDPTLATVTGRWVATVKRPYKGIFPQNTYVHEQQIALQYLVSAVENPDKLKERAKGQCYMHLVETLKSAIRTHLLHNPPQHKKTGVSSRNAMNLHGITD